MLIKIRYPNTVAIMISLACEEAGAKSREMSQRAKHAGEGPILLRSPTALLVPPTMREHARRL